MTKKVLLLSLLVYGVQVDAAPHARGTTKAATKAVTERAMFSFKNVVAGEPMDPTQVGTCSAKRDGAPGELECDGSDKTVAGIELLVAPTYYFYNRRLTTMLYLYETETELST